MRAPSPTASPPTASPPAELTPWCVRLLESGDLATKLTPPLCPDGTPLRDDAPSEPTVIDGPARAPGLEMSSGLGRLPKPGAMRDPTARALALARFAHHELMAVELFAWALLRWPTAPAPLREGLVRALADEQKHCRLYLDRLAAHGAALEAFEHSDYFWKQAPAIAASPHGLAAFLAAMGLTLEQANLDFTLTYRDAFHDAGDEESARVSQVVHDDEISHVRLAAHWLPRLLVGSEVETAPASRAGLARDDLALYEAVVPFPLGASRAKGRRFEPAPRRLAGLSDRFIEHVRAARSPQEARRGGPPASDVDGTG